ncbi:BamA/TamA family outer membrane protein [Sediminicola luteus]|uniref:Bacterial surface antigen (D15) domain-containing protein n=1 Tax=Sediminicola luteus TaxID=319238 RepID=A0A2A4G8S2_9FLAO|nr:BamA/TamA family outer membrane protein [Sediminicola luteus]PCE64374.1 hypothetical protein B7P33_08755 [Sediminicola luteus]
MKIQPIKWGTAILYCWLFINLGFAQDTTITVSKFRDAEDGAIDLSNYLLKGNGVLPVLVPVTEPAVGYGLIGAGLYFIPKKKPGYQPDIAVLAGGVTTNGSWLGGGGYNGFWNEDRIRYRGIMGYADLNLEFYVFGNRPVEIGLGTFLFIQQIATRIKDSDFFIGGKYGLNKTKIPLFEDREFIDPREWSMLSSGLGLYFEYDTLDNFLSPTKGVKFHLGYDQNLELLGSDRDWGKLNVLNQIYIPFASNWMSAFRVDGKLATGKIPFYAKPYVELRGVPAMRYQGELAMMLETEQTLKLGRRWGLVGFTGMGAAFDSVDQMKAEELVWNVGLGARYKIARLLGLDMGMDIARGPEDWAFYVVVGSSWLR